jgi:hypothetical protein
MLENSSNLREFEKYSLASGSILFSIFTAVFLNFLYHLLRRYISQQALINGPCYHRQDWAERGFEDACLTAQEKTRRR